MLSLVQTGLVSYTKTCNTKPARPQHERIRGNLAEHFRGDFEEFIKRVSLDQFGYFLMLFSRYA